MRLRAKTSPISAWACGKGTLCTPWKCWNEIKRYQANHDGGPQPSGPDTEGDNSSGRHG